ncbi:MAG: hypothetical protein QOI10_3721, partial [Solirubrobacterales bacterium]|nr:hypothetical protein [Solirubrobacterales bacterium]
MVAVWADLAPAFVFSATSRDANFTAFLPTDPQIALIQAALVKLYNGSATARALIDQGGGLTTDAEGVSRFTKQITIYKCPDPGNSIALPGQNIIAINTDIVNNLVWIGVDGKLHKEVLEDTVIHELVHAITGRLDYTDPLSPVAYNAANYNFPGPTQNVANQVMLELGYGPDFRQAGYLATVGAGSSLRSDLSYTEGNLVSGAVLLRDRTDDGGPNVDVSQNTFSYLGDSLYGTALNSDLAGNKNLLIIGDSRNNQIKGNVGNDYLYGGTGNDTISGGSGNDLIHGGLQKTAISADGTDTADYSSAPNAIHVNIDSNAATSSEKMDGLTPIIVSDDGYGGRDRLFSIEKIKLGEKNDIVTIGATFGDLLKPLQEIDSGGGRNTLDLTQISSGITFENNKIKGYDTQFKNFNTINLGSGNNTVKGTGPGTIVKSGGGANKIEASHNGQMLFENASTADRITYYGSTLTGGVHWGGSESVYAYGIHFERYGRNQQGDLVIVDGSGNQTFIPRFNFSTDGTNRTAGLYVIDVHFEIRKGNMWTTGFEAAAAMLKSLRQIGAALFGTPLHGTDPLVLDLDGNGLPLTGREISGVVFDINNNKFATPTGWVDRNDGILVRDLNGNGSIDDDSEMFGGPQAAGFAQLATLDGNHDGKVDASDNALADFNGDGTVDASDTFDSLKVWVDANQDGVTDAGELHALSDYDIVSIGVGSTPSTLTDSGNDIVATGTFQRGDGTTGMVGEVQLDTDNHNTRWTGDSSVSAAAASRPDLKGFGTLTDLHVAMTLDPGLIDVV